MDKNKSVELLGNFFGVSDIKKIIYQNEYFPSKRIELIRKNKLNELDLILKSIKIMADEKSEVNELVDVLSINLKWHRGEWDTLSELDIAYESEDVMNLSKLLFSYVHNTNAKFRDSLDLLKSIDLNKVGHLTKLYSGSQIESAVYTWIFWNCGELKEQDDAKEAKVFVESVYKKNSSTLDNKSRSLIFLAAGVYYLRFRDYRLSIKYLKSAKLYDSQKKWIGRINSALCIAYIYGNKIKLAKSYLSKSMLNLDGHFGPLGWQLRIVEGLVFFSELNEAKKILLKIYNNTYKKSEIGYNIWSKIFLFKYFNDEAVKKKINRDDLLRDILKYNMNSALESFYD